MAAGLGQKIMVINRMTAKWNTLRDQLTNALAVNGIDVSQLLPKIQEPETVVKPSARPDEKGRKSK